MSPVTDYFIVDESYLKASTDTELLCLQIAIGLYFLIIPILIYYAFKYSKHRHAACMIPRRPTLTIWIQIFAIFSCINRILRCANALYPHYYILRIVFVSTYSFINHFILWLAAVKYWLLFYDIRFVLFCHGNEWKSHINPNNITYFTNWYVLNRETIGQQNYLLRHLCFMLCVPIMIVTVSSFFVYTAHYEIFINLFLFMIPLTLIAVIWNKTPKYLDYFRVRDECRMLLFIGCIVGFMFLSLAVAATFLFDAHKFFLIVFCIELVYLFGLFLACMHLTFWTLLKNKHRLKEYNQAPSALYVKYRKLNKMISGKSLERTLSSQMYNHQKEDHQTLALLISVIEHAHAFEVFLIHLLTEFNLESALAIIELTQYQTVMKKLYDTQNENILKMPDFVPESVIIYDPEKKDGQFDVEQIAQKLLKKYIANNAKFEINISYKLKKRLLSDLESLENENDALSDKKFAHLFDDCVGSLLLLLNDSLARFVETEKYKQIEKELAAVDKSKTDIQRHESIQTEYAKVDSIRSTVVPMMTIEENVNDVDIKSDDDEADEDTVLSHGSIETP